MAGKAVSACPWEGNPLNDQNSFQNCDATAEDFDSWICAICLNKIELEQISQIKGCEHAYCLPCILQWSTFKEVPWCPQCRKPFSSLFSYRNLDGSYVDYMVEESLCLLVRANWFHPKFVIEEEEPEEYFEEDYYDEEYFHPSIRIGNRRWGENGFVSGGRMVARPRVNHASISSSSSSNPNPNPGADPRGKEPMGRRAKRNLKRESRKQGAGSQS